MGQRSKAEIEQLLEAYEQRGEQTEKLVAAAKLKPATVKVIPIKTAVGND